MHSAQIAPDVHQKIHTLQVSTSAHLRFEI